ncbi:hypothetical protein CALCODRAFT_47710 [Calocera cornea HHB12733]|uniref:Uncharacterized protein n=1 Tax=Calocera cornea HHB12733 TaxID=1353952 RepID=A0A165DV01_9BASI|nr:hypothetical protein CALCODRAFT_47710 [Calocera cornea HHB12733]
MGERGCCVCWQGWVDSRSSACRDGRGEVGIRAAQGQGGQQHPARGTLRSGAITRAHRPLLLLGWSAIDLGDSEDGHGLYASCTTGYDMLRYARYMRII